MSLRHDGSGPDQQHDEETPIVDELAEFPRQFRTAGQLATMMAALPPETPIQVAETVHVDLDLPAGAETITAPIAKVVSLMEPAKNNRAGCSTQPSCHPVTCVELGAVIIAKGSPVPRATHPYQPYESAMRDLRMGDVVAALAEGVKLLSWIADLLGDPLQEAAHPTGESIGVWVGNDDLRRQLDVEAGRLRYSAVRIIKLRELIADDEVNRLRLRGGVVDRRRDPGMDRR